MIGRAYLWGLAANGQPGVENVLDILRDGIVPRRTSNSSCRAWSSSRRALRVRRRSFVVNAVTERVGNDFMSPFRRAALEVRLDLSARGIGMPQVPTPDGRSRTPWRRP